MGRLVEGDTKSSRSRQVDIDRRTIDALRTWRQRQSDERAAADDAWSTTAEDHLFTNEVGEPYRPDWLAAEFDRAHAATGLPRLVFHGLRHTSATVLLTSGVQVTS